MASYEYIGYGSLDGMQICKGASEKVGFYGAVPVVQRPYTSSVHATAAAVSSTTFPDSQLAILQEIQNTFIALGWWATA